MRYEKMAESIRGWIESVGYYLMRTNGTAYGLFLQRVQVEAAPRPIAGKLPIIIGVTPSGYIRIRVHKPSVEAVPMAVAAELLKRAVLRVIYGHMTIRRKLLSQRFGTDIFMLASDLVIHGSVDVGLLKGMGLEVPIAKDYGLQENQTCDYYCEALTKNDPATPGLQLMDRKPEVIAQYREEVRVSLPEFDADDEFDNDTPLAVLSNTHVPFEAVDTGDIPTEIVDMTIDNITAQVQKEYERTTGNSGDHSGRGWGSSELKEYIKQVRRKPSMPWFQPLKQMEQCYRKEERVLTNKRPSRRHPEHFGRLRKKSLYCWFGIDTSGSMQDALKLVEAEVRGIYSRGAEIMMLQINSELHNKRLYRPSRPLVEFNGRGGTDFSPFLFELFKERHKPAFAVFFTDGYGCLTSYLKDLEHRVGKAEYKRLTSAKRSATPEGVELLWLLVEGTTDPESFRKNVAPFGRIAVIPKELVQPKED